MVHIFDEVDQKRCHMHNSADLRVLFCQCVGVVVSPADLLYILRQRNKQSGGIPLLHQIPQVQQTGHSAVAVKPRMRVGDVEVDERCCLQYRDSVFVLHRFILLICLIPGLPLH